MLNNRESEEFCLSLQGSRGLSCIEDLSGPWGRVRVWGRLSQLRNQTFSQSEPRWLPTDFREPSRPALLNFYNLNVWGALAIYIHSIEGESEELFYFPQCELKQTTEDLPYQSTYLRPCTCQSCLVLVIAYAVFVGRTHSSACAGIKPHREAIST